MERSSEGMILYVAPNSDLDCGLLGLRTILKRLICAVEERVGLHSVAIRPNRSLACVCSRRRLIFSNERI